MRNTNPTPVAETQRRHRRSRWKPPGYLCVADLVGTAPLSRASVYREIASGKLRSARSRGHIFVHKDDYSRWLADAAALRSNDPGNHDVSGAADPVEEAADE